MLRVLADDHNLALAADDLALLTDRLYRRSYLHDILPPSNFLRNRSIVCSVPFWWDGTPENRRPLALGSHTRLRPLFYHRHTPSGVIESENRYAIFIKSAGFARAFDSPTQRPWGASFGYQKQVSLELVFVYRGLSLVLNLRLAAEKG